MTSTSTTYAEEAKRWRGHAASDRATRATIELVDVLDRLLSRPERSRAGLREDLETVATLALEVRAALRRASTPWSTIRADALDLLAERRGHIDVVRVDPRREGTVPRRSLLYP